MTLPCLSRRETERAVSKVAVVVCERNFFYDCHLKSVTDSRNDSAMFASSETELLYQRLQLSFVK